MRYDLAIVGSGAAAFAAAITAADAGASVLMVERGSIGGTCVNTGCVPSKALLAAAAARHDAAGQRFPGIATQAGPVDMAALTAGKDEMVAAMRAGKYLDLAAEYGWEIIAGTARFAGGPDAPVLQARLDGGGRRVRGVHAVAGGAGEMIIAACYAIQAGMTVTDLAGAWAPYLTVSEGLRLAAQAFSRDVSRLSCCAA